MDRTTSHGRKQYLRKPDVMADDPIAIASIDTADLARESSRLEPRSARAALARVAKFRTSVQRSGSG